MDTQDDRPAVLVVDDDKNTRDGLRRALAGGYDVYVAESGERALDVLAGQEISVLLTDVRMPGMDGLTLLHRALARNPGLVCILLTAYGSVETAVEAMKRGAYDFLTKPVNLDHLDLLLKRALHSRRIESENAALRRQVEDKYGLENIVGSSPAMRHLYEVIAQAAPAQATVLVQGESGTGKELVAHALHNLSTRSQGPFVAVHCAALTPSLLESELFGHEKHAFTGAESLRRGRFENADGGTLFLDEVSEIDASIQVKLLRVLEERAFERVGGSEPVHIDIRLIAASNRDLRQVVADGGFREDLFFRLDVVNIVIPPLRDRLEDVPMLCSHFLAEFNAKNGKHVESITPDAVQLLTAHRWPGNVRELRNTIEKMVVFARGPKLSVRDIPANIRDATRGEVGIAGAAVARGGRSQSLADAERQMIAGALARHGNNRTKAASDLGISRRTLHRKLRQYRDEDAIASRDEEARTGEGE